jgi:competence protein ComEC
MRGKKEKNYEKETVPVSPVTCAAAGAAAGYYGLFPLCGQMPLVPALLAVAGLGIPLFLSLRASVRRAPPKARRGICRACGKAAAALAGFCMGAALSAPPRLSLGLPAQRVTGIYGTLQDDPRHSGRGTLRVSRTLGIDGALASASGTVYALFPESAVPRLRTFGRGSAVFIEGRFLPQRARPLFSARSAQVLKNAPAPERIRSGIRTAIITRFAEPAWGGLALALLLGDKERLDTGLDRSYRDAGCSYMLALSGMHLAVIAGVISLALKRLLGLKAAAIAGMIGILCYVYLVGNLPSLRRAAIMYVLGTAAVLGMLPKKGDSLLGLSFLIQICLNSQDGRSVSFMLSYLALFGMLFMGNAALHAAPGVLPRFVAAPLAASFGAFMATAPVVALFFQVLRPFGIITGLAVVPLTSLFMLGSIAALAFDALLPVPVFGVVLSGLYAILEQLVRCGARFPGVSPPVPLVIAAALLTALWCRHIAAAKRGEVAPFDYTV